MKMVTSPTVAAEVIPETSTEALELKGAGGKVEPAESGFRFLEAFGTR